jgi:hypothetical protein
MLHRLIAAMRSTESTELKYLMERMAPVVLAQMGRAHTLRGNL